MSRDSHVSAPTAAQRNGGQFSEKLFEICFNRASR
jgi:hypothetical protein